MCFVVTLKLNSRTAREVFVFFYKSPLRLTLVATYKFTRNSNRMENCALVCFSYSINEGFIEYRMQTHLHTANGIDLLVIVAWEILCFIRNDLSYLCRQFSNIFYRKLRENAVMNTVNFNLIAICHCWSAKAFKSFILVHSNILNMWLSPLAVLCMFSHRVSHLHGKKKIKNCNHIHSELSNGVAKLFSRAVIQEKFPATLFALDNYRETLFRFTRNFCEITPTG